MSKKHKLKLVNDNKIKEAKYKISKMHDFEKIEPRPFTKDFFHPQSFGPHSPFLVKLENNDDTPLTFTVYMNSLDYVSLFSFFKNGMYVEPVPESWLEVDRMLDIPILSMLHNTNYMKHSDSCLWFLRLRGYHAVKDKIEDAVKYNQFETIKWMYFQAHCNDGKSKQPKSLFSNNPFTTNIMRLAVKYGNLEMVKFLYKNGYELSPEDGDLALEYGQAQIINWLKNHLYRQVPFTKSGMKTAIKNNHFHLRDIILLGAPLNAYEFTACDLFTVSATCGNFEFFEYFVGVYQDYENPCFLCPLAAKAGSIKMLELLLEYDTIDYDWTYAADYAASGGHIDVFKWCIEHKGEYSSKSINYASKNGHLEMVKYLVENFQIKSNKAIKCASENKHFDIVLYLLEKNYEFDLELLMFSVLKNGHLEMVKHLVENFQIKSNEAINCALENKHFDIVLYLLEKNYEFDPEILVFKASKYGQSEILLFLMENCRLDKHQYSYKASDQSAIMDHFDCLKLIIQNHGPLSEFAKETAEKQGFLKSGEHSYIEEVQTYEWWWFDMKIYKWVEQ